MTQERWFRGSDEAATFDWSRSARALDVSADIARALYVRAMQRAADSGPRRAQELYLRWLQEAARAARLAAPLVPGRDTRVLRDAKPRELRELERLGPGRWTRSLFEAAKPEDAADAADAAETASERPGQLPAALRARMERAFGERFDDVELRRDSTEVRTGQQAFTRDREIHLEQDVDLDSAQGEHVVAHELAHVAQQARPAGRMASRAALEADAHQAAQRVLAGQAAQVRLAAPRSAALAFSHGEASEAPASAHALDGASHEHGAQTGGAAMDRGASTDPVTAATAPT
ncbi:MAG: DUF4157 domain-containing protein, partial [Kofleriaceae bacterium]